MGDKRLGQRLRKRVRVSFENKGVKGTGFSANLSATGFLVNATMSCPPGSIIRGILLSPDGLEVKFEAQVRWVSKVNGPLAQLFKSSMGVKFLGPPEETYYRLLSKIPAGEG